MRKSSTTKVLDDELDSLWETIETLKSTVNALSVYVNNSIEVLNNTDAANVELYKRFDQLISDLTSTNGLDGIISMLKVKVLADPTVKAQIEDLKASSKIRLTTEGKNVTGNVDVLYGESKGNEYVCFGTQFKQIYSYYPESLEFVSRNGMLVKDKGIWLVIGVME